MASPMANRFGNTLPRTTSTVVSGRIRRKKRKSTKEEEKEISERLERQQAMRLARQKDAIERRRNMAAEAIPQVLENESVASAVAPAAAPAVDMTNVDALVPQADPRLQQDAMLQASLAQGDPSMINPGAEYGEVLEQPIDQAPTVAAGGDVAALARQQVVQTPPMSPTDQLNKFSEDYLKKVSMRKKIMQSLTAAFGGTSIADDYEKEALAKYTNYVNNQAGKIALAGGNADAAMGITRFLDAGGDLDQALELFGKPGAATTAPTSNKIVEMRYDKTAGKEIPHDVYREWTSNGWQEVSAAPKTTAGTTITANITTPGQLTQSAMAKGFGKKLGDILGDTTTFSPIHAESAQLPLLIEAIAGGHVDTGKIAEWSLPIKQAFAALLPDSEQKRLFTGNLGRTEWFKAVSDSFIGGKLAMTKGSISEREMAIFQKMIPSLSLTPEGNIRLLNMMHALNRIALSVETGAVNFSKWADTQEKGLAGRSGNANFLKLKEFQTEERKRAARFLRYLANSDVAPGRPPVPLERAKAFIQWRGAVPVTEMSDEQINKELDARGYPSG